MHHIARVTTLKTIDRFVCCMHSVTPHCVVCHQSLKMNRSNSFTYPLFNVNQAWLDAHAQTRPARAVASAYQPAPADASQSLY
jgi:hypothetical protein